MDGFANLLRNRGFSDNRSLVLSLLFRARCRIVGILSPYEYEEHLSSDAEAHDLFSVLHLHEPEVSVAIKLVRHYASGLQEQYRVRIEEDAMV